MDCTEGVAKMDEAEDDPLAESLAVDADPDTDADADTEPLLRAEEGKLMDTEPDCEALDTLPDAALWEIEAELAEMIPPEEAL